jgi:hypothetical protein
VTAQGGGTVPSLRSWGDREGGRETRRGGSWVAIDDGGRGGVIQHTGRQDPAGGRCGAVAAVADLVRGGERVWACVWTEHEHVGLSPLSSVGQS